MKIKITVSQIGAWGLFC